MIYGSDIFVLQMKAFPRITRSHFDNLHFRVFDAWFFFSFLELKKETKIAEKRKKVASTAQILSK